MATSELAGRIRALTRMRPARAFRDRHTRRVRVLVRLLESEADEVVIRPWELRLPRTVILAAARSRGREPVGGEHALAERGLWSHPMRFSRKAAPAPAREDER